MQCPVAKQTATSRLMSGVIGRSLRGRCPERRWPLARALPGGDVGRGKSQRRHVGERGATVAAFLGNRRRGDDPFAVFTAIGVERRRPTSRDRNCLRAPLRLPPFSSARAGWSDRPDPDKSGPQHDGLKALRSCRRAQSVPQGFGPAVRVRAVEGQWSGFIDATQMLAARRLRCRV